jgi:3-hydroxyisobutyrate dehydrogenase
LIFGAEALRAQQGSVAAPGLVRGRVAVNTAQHANSAHATRRGHLMTRIALLGLGAMGQRMARRLLEAGHELTVWNRSPAAAEPLVRAGARPATTPRQAADGAELVWSMVYDDAASQRVWLADADGAAAALARDAIAVESSTLGAEWVSQLAAHFAAAGTAFVDAPVAGSRVQAEAGQLIFMAGGMADVVDRLRPVLAALGSAVHHVGPVGSGAWLKLVVNTLFATQVAAMAEQLGVLRKAGIEASGALAALRAMPVTSPAAAGAASLMLARNFSPQAPVDLIAKDLGYALRSGQQLGADMPLTAAVQARLQAAQAAGFGADNVVALARLYD